MKKILFFFALFLALHLNFSAQIRIKEIASELPTYLPNYSSSETREIISLNKDWTFTPEKSKNTGVSVNIPSVYNSNETIVFQKKIDLSNIDLSGNIFKLNFLGISYSADIFINDILIHKMAGGNIPFSLEIPNDILSATEDNVLKVLVSKELDSQNTIPLAQRFLFPKNSGGIVRDVFLEIIPNENLSLEDYTIQIENDLKAASINFNFRTLLNSNQIENNYFIEISAFNETGKILSKRETLSPNTDVKLISISISNPKIWSFENPYQYNFEFRLLKNDQLIDASKKNIAIAKIENRPDGIFLNNSKFDFKGVTYIPSDKELGELISFVELKKDLEIIKSLGINSVRFAKATPHPYALEVCSEIGLIALIEIPLNAPPEMIVDNKNFFNRAERFTSDFVKYYSNYSSILLVGLGSGYLSESKLHSELLEKLTIAIENKSKILTYASFSSLPKNELDYLDLYGIEVFNDVEKLDVCLENSLIPKNRIFISEATYPNYLGNTNGYLNEYSFEAQAKYFEQIIDKSKSSNLTGFFINSMFDYYGDFSSFYTKYSEDNLYKIGILGVDKSINRAGYSAIKSKLTNSQRVTIPIGSAKDDAPMIFIVIGLILAILMGILVNSKKKLREDATRAFIRPYNFFADIRDHRIISGFATIFLMLILAGSHSLLISNILFYLKNNILFEKLLLAFGSPKLMSLLNYLAWNPADALSFFFIASIVFFLVLSSLIFLTSFFIKIKIFFRSIFYTVIWAVLPLALLLPVKMVLYRILLVEEFNLFIYGFLVVYFLWIAKRILTGVYVIFDISASRAYFYSFIAALLIFGSVLFYFQIYHSTIYYLVNVIKQANLI